MSGERVAGLIRDLRNGVPVQVDGRSAEVWPFPYEIQFYESAAWRNGFNAARARMNAIIDRTAAANVRCSHCGKRP